MVYPKITEAVFVCRPNRFLANVRIAGKEVTVHIKNTGRCKELLTPNAKVWLCETANPRRKTRYDLVTVEKPAVGPVNLDSQAPNQAMEEWLKKQDWDSIQREQAYGASRFDFKLEKGGKTTWLEVKGCTLERNGLGFFPDAPTGRGTRHVRELTAAKRQGYNAAIAFVIQMNGVQSVKASDTDENFRQALSEARQAGVEIWHMRCHITPDSIEILDCWIEPDKKEARPD